MWLQERRSCVVTCGQLKGARVDYGVWGWFRRWNGLSGCGRRYALRCRVSLTSGAPGLKGPGDRRTVDFALLLEEEGGLLPSPPRRPSDRRGSGLAPWRRHYVYDLLLLLILILVFLLG